jgi:hypothetical protein
MQKMRLFLDTHDAARGSFPKGLTGEQFEAFYPSYLEACAAEGVVNLDIQVALQDGRAFCLNLAPDAEAVRRAHARVGLPFDDISEVRTASPGAIFFKSAA